MTHDEEYDTTVLSDDYDDYRDTVVDQVIAFDPSVFQGAQNGSTGSSASVEYGFDENTGTLGASQSIGRPSTTSYMTMSQSTAPTSTATSDSSVWQSAPHMTPSMVTVADRKPAKTSSLFMVAIVILGIVGVIAIVLAFAFAFGPKENAKPAAIGSSAPIAIESPISSSSSASSSAATEVEKSEESLDAEKPDEASYKHSTGSATIVAEGNGHASAEAEFYNKLTEYYNKAGEFDANVLQCAEEFNSYYLADEKSVRSAKSNAAASLKSKIKSSWDELKSLTIPFMSKNIDAHEQLCELYECLWHRIDVIDQAWKISLQFEKPKGHDNEILKPIRDQQSNGADRYYARFNELHPNIKLMIP